MSLLEVTDLTVQFGNTPAVRGISFAVEEGAAVGIVGESGCGKSSAVQALMGLTPGQIGGKVLFDGKETMRPGKEVGMIFQDPMTSLNPTMKIGAQIAEGLIYHKMASRKQACQKAIDLLHLVGVNEPQLRANQYPHQLSGGMRQRVLIAIAIACNPRLLIADEPTTALDVTLQAQILDLIQRMRKHFQMSLLLISHNFGVIASVCDTVLVMYAGKIVERGSVEEVLKRPRHPYTQMLLNSVPRLDKPRSEPLQVIDGSPPHLSLFSKGCSFKERCPYAALKCQQEPAGLIACWRVR